MTVQTVEADALGRIEFRPTERERAIDCLRDSYRVNMQGSGGRDGQLSARSRIGDGSFALHDLGPPLRLRSRQDPLNSLIIVTLRAGEWVYECDGLEDRFLPGDVFIAAEPSRPFTVRLWEAHAQTMTLDLALLAQVATGSSGRAGSPIRWTGLRPVSAAAATSWKHTVNYVSELLATPEAAAQPLIMGNTARLLAAAALATFPNTAVTAPTARNGHDATGATVRRASEFIEQHAHIDISLADIAAAASVSIRAVQVAFRRHRDTTPMTFVREVRLNRVHQELLSADPGGGATVTEIATRWGFHNLSRFAARYRRIYGVNPGHTLHNR